MLIKAYAPINIEYVKENGETSTRTVIPTVNVPSNIKAVDISNLSASEQEKFITLFEEYGKYVNQHMATMFKFQTWVEHTTGEHLEGDMLGGTIPWRTFKHDQTKIVD